jgi:hypothetical protein
VYNTVGQHRRHPLAPITTGFVIKFSGGSYTSAFVLAGVMLAASTLSYWVIVGPMKEKR